MDWHGLISSPAARAIYEDWHARLFDSAAIEARAAQAAAAEFYRIVLGRHLARVVIFASPEQALLALGSIRKDRWLAGGSSQSERLEKLIPADIMGGLAVAIDSCVGGTLIEPVITALTSERLGAAPAEKRAAAMGRLREGWPSTVVFDGRPRSGFEDSIERQRLDVGKYAGFLAQRDFLRWLGGTPAAAMRADIEATLAKLCRVSPYIWLLPDTVILAERPDFIADDFASGRRGFSGTGLRFRDGFTIEIRGGETLPTWLMEAPHLITPKHIERQTNAEIRRLLLERMGYQRYIAESGAELTHEDETGKLWRREYSLREGLRYARVPLVFVEVVNGTPETDGTYRHYFLRVPPGMRSAREAVAWTYGLRADDYTPTVRT